MKRKSLRKLFGQSVAEYVILFASVSAAFVFLHFAVMRHAIQGVVKVAADEAGKQEDAAQYLEDGGADSDYTQLTTSHSLLRKRENANKIQIYNKDIETESSIRDGISYSEEVVD